MKTMQVYFWIFLLVTSRNGLGSSIEASGTITTNTIWNADTVKITGDINVIDSVTLTILPGTQVRFQGMYGIGISGRLIAIGTPQNKIVFTSEDTIGYASGTDVGWAGIHFSTSSSNSDSSKLQNCSLSFCKSAAVNVNAPSKVFISNNDILLNEIGILIYSDLPILINNNKIAYNRSSGIKIEGYSAINNNSCIYNNQILWNMGSGIEITQCQNLLISHNIINHNSGHGIVVFNMPYSYYDIYTSNNIICNNSGYGINIESFIYASVSRSTICYNGEGLNISGGESSFGVNNTILWNYGMKFGDCPLEIIATWHLVGASASYCVVQGGFKWRETYHDGCLSYDHIISDEPKFVDAANDDYSLMANSPCINRGTPGPIPPDETDIIGNPRCFGDTIDIGAYEFINYSPMLMHPIPNQFAYEYLNFSYTIPDSTFTDINVGDSLTFNAFTTNMQKLPGWLTFDTINLVFNGTPTASDTGSLCVIVKATDLFQASCYDTFYIDIEGNATKTNNNYASVRKLRVYPNPSENLINITFNGNWSSYVTITIYDTNGKVCYFIKSIPAAIPHVLNLKGFNKGEYFMEAMDGKYREISSFILK